MNYEIVKKNVYYDPPDEYPFSARNFAQDFADFHIPLAQLHHATVHDRGVAAGLEVSGAVNATQLAINPGTAVDGAGKLIVLATTGHGDIGNNPPIGDNNEVPVPVNLPLGGHASSTVYLTIQFSQILRASEGSGGRLEQVPWLRLQPTAGPGAYVDDGTSVILAIAVINAGGTLVSLKAQDGALTYRRRTLGENLEEVRVRRSMLNGNQVADTTAARLNSGPGGGLQIGVTGAGDNIVLAKDDGTQCARVETRAGVVVCKDSAGREVMVVDANNAWLRVGAQGNEGDIVVQDGAGQAIFAVDGAHARVDVGGPNNGGHLYLRDSGSNLRVHLDGNAGALNANNLNPYGGSAIDVGARFFRIHGWDLVLDGRSGGNKRALVDYNNLLVVNFANDYSQGVQVGSDLAINGVLSAKGDILMGNPVRKVEARWLFSKNGAWTTEDVVLPGARQFFAFVSLVVINSTTDFDYDNAALADIMFIDGSPTGTWLSAPGSNLGGTGDPRNMHAPTASGVAQTITFRVAALGPDINAAAIGIVFYE